MDGRAGSSRERRPRRACCGVRRSSGASFESFDWRGRRGGRRCVDGGLCKRGGGERIGRTCSRRRARSLGRSERSHRVQQALDSCGDYGEDSGHRDRQRQRPGPASARRRLFARDLAGRGERRRRLQRASPVPRLARTSAPARRRHLRLDPEHGGQRLDLLDGALEALRGVACACPREPRVEARTEAGAPFGRGNHRLERHLRDDLHDAAVFPVVPADEQLERDQPEREAVRAGRDRHVARARLLGRHVQRGPHDLPRPRFRPDQREHLGDAEIEDLEQGRAVVPLRQEQVRRLEITMHDSERVRPRQTARHLPEPLDHLDGPRRYAERQRVEVGSVEHLHDEERHPAELVGDARVGDPHDVIAPDSPRRARLGPEAIDGVLGEAERRRDDLEREPLPRVLVLDLVDRAHASLPDQPDRPVLAPDFRRELEGVTGGHVHHRTVERGRGVGQPTVRSLARCVARCGRSCSWR